MSPEYNENSRRREYFLLSFSIVLFVIFIGTITYVSLKQQALYDEIFNDIRQSHQLAEKR